MAAAVAATSRQEAYRPGSTVSPEIVAAAISGLADAVNTGVLVLLLPPLLLLLPWLASR